MQEVLTPNIQADIALLTQELAAMDPTDAELLELARDRDDVRRNLDKIEHGIIDPGDRTTLGKIAVLDRPVLEQPGAVLRLMRMFNTRTPDAA